MPWRQARRFRWRVYREAIFLPANKVAAAQSSDARRSLAELYRDFDDYLMQYEKATEKLIAEGYLLAGFKRDYMNIAAQNSALFDE